MDKIARITALIYLLFLLKFVVFKDMDMVLVGNMRFYFGGTQTGPANWVPFETMMAYFRGEKGLLITGLNLAGNLALLCPLGFLYALSSNFVSFRRISLLSFGLALAIECVQTALNLGIFDVDDILLNGLGGIVAYWISSKLPRKWQFVCLVLLLGLMAMAGIYYLLFSVPFEPPHHP
jgi:glycopeptide antibiotics resistance protein